MKFIISSIYLIFLPLILSAQSVSINGDGSMPDPSSILDLKSETKGLLIPRMTATQRLNIISPVEGLMVYDNTFSDFYYYNGTSWLKLDKVSNEIFDNDGDTGIDAEASPDNDQILFYLANSIGFRMRKNINGVARIEGSDNLLWGTDAGLNLSPSGSLSGQRNVYLGYNVGEDALSTANNVGIGYKAMEKITTGSQNTAVGQSALDGATTSGSNAAFGQAALSQTGTGSNNTGIGTRAGQNNPGTGNTFLGALAGDNSSGDYNVFLGHQVGSTATGGNKLYIDNSSTNSPLIYGEFDNNLLRIHGELNIDNNYSLPTSPGSAGAIIQSTGINTVAQWTPYIFPLSGGSTNQVLKKNNGISMLWADDEVNDADANPTNEIQSLSISGMDLSLSGSNTITLPAGSSNLWENGVGNNIYYTDGNVSIGTPDFLAALGVQALTKAGKFVTSSSFGGDLTGIEVTANSTNATSSDSIVGVEIDVSGNDGVQIGLLSTASDYGSLAGKFVGDVDITGHLVVASDLDVVGNLDVDGDIISRRGMISEDGKAAFFFNEDGDNDSDNIVLKYSNANRFAFSGHTIEWIDNAGIYLGQFAGATDSSINPNIVIGNNSMTDNVSGQYNLVIGDLALQDHNNGNHNIALGTGALKEHHTGAGNVSVGFNSGFYNVGGSYNVFLGHWAGGDEMGSNKLYIENSSSSNPLIYGDFSDDFLECNGRLRIDAPNNVNPFQVLGNSTTRFLVHDNGGISNHLVTPTYAFQLQNSSTDLEGKGIAFSWNTYSDKRLKSNIRPLAYGLNDLMRLRPKSYDHHSSIIDEATGLKKLDTSHGTATIGLIAQEVNEVLPEVVSIPQNDEDYWSVDYSKIVPLLIQSIQEQQEQIELLMKEIEQLKKK